MKALLLAALLLAPAYAHASGELFQKQITLSAEESAARTPPPGDPGPLLDALRWQVLEASNAERARVGLPPLAPDPVLDDAAARYSEKMRDYRFFAHVSPDGETLDDRVPATDMWRYQGLGENLWSGQGALDWRSDRLSAEAAANWVESPGHRDNLFDPDYTVAGVGSAMVDDQLYITMLYATPVEDEAQAILQRDYGDAPADLGGFTAELERSLTEALNTQRAQTGLDGLIEDAVLSDAARRHAEEALGGDSFASGSVLEDAFAADPGRSGRLAAGFWRGSGALVWQADAVAERVIARWLNGQAGADALDPGFGQVGIGVASNGEVVLVTVLFGEATGTGGFY